MKYTGNFKIVFIMLLVAIILTIFGCNIMTETERVAETFLHAIAENDISTLEEVVDPEHHKEIPKYRLSSLTEGVSGEFTELILKTTSNNGNRATVAYEGKLQITASESTKTVQGEVYLTKNNGRWCVSALEDK